MSFLTFVTTSPVLISRMTIPYSSAMRALRSKAFLSSMFSLSSEGTNELSASFSQSTKNSVFSPPTFGSGRSADVLPVSTPRSESESSGLSSWSSRAPQAQRRTVSVSKSAVIGMFTILFFIFTLDSLVYLYILGTLPEMRHRHS